MIPRDDIGRGEGVSNSLNVRRELIDWGRAAVLDAEDEGGVERSGDLGHLDRDKVRNHDKEERLNKDHHLQGSVSSVHRFSEAWSK